MNWMTIVLVSMIVAVLIIFMIIRNKKDRKDLTKKLNTDYPKTKDEEGDAPIEDTVKP